MYPTLSLADVPESTAKHCNLMGVLWSLCEGRAQTLSDGGTDAHHERVRAQEHTCAGEGSCGRAPRPAQCRTAAALCVPPDPWPKSLRQSEPPQPERAEDFWETDGLMRENTDQIRRAALFPQTDSQQLHSDQ